VRAKMMGSRALVLSSLVTLGSAFVGCAANTTGQAGTGGNTSGGGTGQGSGGNTPVRGGGGNTGSGGVSGHGNGSTSGTGGDIVSGGATGGAGGGGSGTGGTAGGGTSGGQTGDGRGGTITDAGGGTGGATSTDAAAGGLGPIGLGAQAPGGAMILFKGNETKAEADAELATKWQKWWDQNGNPWAGTSSPGKTITFKVMPDPEFPGDANRWTLMSCCSATWGYDDVVSIYKHADAQIHVEFNMLGEYEKDYSPIPNPVTNEGDGKSSGQRGYSNSGVYVQSRHELQIISDNDANKCTTDSHGMAALVDEKSVDSNQTKPNGVWQSYDVIFRTSRWSGSNKTSDAFITVYWNKVKVHDNVHSRAPATGFANHSGEELSPNIYGLKLQSEGRDVRYRNIWIQPLEIKDEKTDLIKP
jgi:hypothetical protein